MLETRGGHYYDIQEGHYYRVTGWNEEDKAEPMPVFVDTIGNAVVRVEAVVAPNKVQTWAILHRVAETWTWSEII
jgi:hypothetical protein